MTKKKSIPKKPEPTKDRLVQFRLSPSESERLDKFLLASGPSWAIDKRSANKLAKTCLLETIMA